MNFYQNLPKYNWKDVSSYEFTLRFFIRASLRIHVEEVLLHFALPLILRLHQIKCISLLDSLAISSPLIISCHFLRHLVV